MPFAKPPRSSPSSRQVRPRARILGFLAEQMRQDKQRQVMLRASLRDADARHREADQRGLIETLRADAEAELERTNEREHALVRAALAARLAGIRAEQKLQADRLRAWLAQATPLQGVPQRRNRPAKLVEKILCRLGRLAAVAIGRSGLWRTAFQIESHPGTRRTTRLDYTRAGPGDVAVKALFDQNFYLAGNPSLGATRQSPLAHYLVYGDRENRSPHPLVDASYYRTANPHELGSTGLTVLQHFLFVGAAKGSTPTRSSTCATMSASSRMRWISR